MGPVGYPHCHINTDGLSKCAFLIPSSYPRFPPTTLVVIISFRREAMKFTRVILFASVAGESEPAPKFGNESVTAY